jgi:hypothetical protein
MDKEETKVIPKKALAVSEKIGEITCERRGENVNGSP